MDRATLIILTWSIVAGCTVRSENGLPLPDSGFVDVIDLVDPFDPANSCAQTNVQTENVPGAILIMLDRSGSMRADVDGETRWTRAVRALAYALSRANPDLQVGISFFSYGTCTVDNVPRVPVGRLGDNLNDILDAMDNESPNGDDTPVVASVRAGWDILDQVASRGQRALVLVTDGEETCLSSDQLAVLTADNLLEEAAFRATNGMRTYAIGLEVSNTLLSTVASAGGTAREPQCVPGCQVGSALCVDDSECASGSTCGRAYPSGPFRTCSCETRDDCATGYRCEPNGFGINQCQPSPNWLLSCCHQAIERDNFEQDFQAVLDEIAGRYARGCRFSVPEPPVGEFDPNLVNVGVTFDGEARTRLPESQNGRSNSWRFTSSEFDEIEIQGPICNELTRRNARVEVVLGCPGLIG